MVLPLREEGTKLRQRQLGAQKGGACHAAAGIVRKLKYGGCRGQQKMMLRGARLRRDASGECGRPLRPFREVKEAPVQSQWVHIQGEQGKSRLAVLQQRLALLLLLRERCFGGARAADSRSRRRFVSEGASCCTSSANRRRSPR